jgi:hypothetical protein
MQVPEDFFNAAWRRSAMLNRIIVEIAHNNLRFGFELTRVKTIFDVLKLQTDYWQKLLNAFQVKKFRNGLVESGEPRSPVIQDETQKETRDYPQPKARDASGPVMGSAAKTPKQGSEQSPKRRARTRAPEVKRKAEVSRSKQNNHLLPSRKTQTGSRKQRARQDTASRGHRAKIQFGRLDDNAVRFTSLEAWRLRDGTWRRISVDKVLSEGVVLSTARFNQLFPQVPQLPAGAFLPDRDQK